jgi:hypothetical protein
MTTTMLPGARQGQSPATDLDAQISRFSPAVPSRLTNSGDSADSETMAIEQDPVFHNSVVSRLQADGETVEAEHLLDQ